MSFVSSPPDVVSRLTDAYHQTVLMGEISNNEISWHVTQHVLDHIWVSSATSSTNANETSSFANNGQSSATATDENIVYACQGCGYILHPGWKGTKLRVKRPNKDGKTIRRREQRKRRRKSCAEETRAKDNFRYQHRHTSSSGPNDGNAVVNTNSSNKSTSYKTHHQRLVLLQDDERSLVRNHLVLTCGRCQDKIYLNGFRREQQMKTNLNATIIPISSTTSTITKMGNLADNFEPLPPSSATAVRPVSYGKKKPSPPQVVSMVAAATSITKNRSSSSSLSLLEQKREEQFGRKKKRKSKVNSISSGKKTGNLLNFLSSFNDH